MYKICLHLVLFHLLLLVNLHLSEVHSVLLCGDVSLNTIESWTTTWPEYKGCGQCIWASAQLSGAVLVSLQCHLWAATAGTDQHQCLEMGSRKLLLLLSEKPQLLWCLRKPCGGLQKAGQTEFASTATYRGKGNTMVLGTLLLKAANQNSASHWLL